MYAHLQGRTDEDICATRLQQELAACWRTDPCDRPAAEHALREVLRLARIPLSDADPATIRWILDLPACGNEDIYVISAETSRHWISYYSTASAYIDAVAAEPEAVYLAQALQRLIDSVHCVIFRAREILLVDRPEIYAVDDLGRPHSTSGPSIRYRGGYSEWHWHGIAVSEAIIRRHYDAAAITDERNQERRRAMIALYGEARWLIESKAIPIDQSDYGRLYELPGGDLVVLVQDGVEQLDGSRPTYALRVDGQCRPLTLASNGSTLRGAPQRRTALNAVASTYGLRGEDYLHVSRT